MKKHTLLSCALAVLLSGCGAHKPVQLLPDQVAEFAKHVISVDRDGKLKIIENGEVTDTVACNSNSEGKTEENRKCDRYLDGIIKGIEEFKSEQLAKNKKEAEVLFFVHGGLNNPEKSLKRAKRIYKDILKDNQKQNPIYPIFVIWDSRGPSSYKDHLVKIRHGDEPNHAKYTSPIYLLTDVGNAIVNTPKSWLVSGLHMFDTTTNVDIEDDLQKEVGKFNNVYYTGNETEKKEFYDFKRSAQWFLTSPSKVVTTPFIYTMGKPAWDIMLRRTNILFYTPEDLSNTSPVEPPVHPFGQRSPGHAALYEFLNRFDCSIKPRNSRDIKNCIGYSSNTALDDIKVTLVGHSMGAIVVNKIIQLKPYLPYKNIVHMASADSINGLFNTVVPYIDYAMQNKKDECRRDKDSPECKAQPVQFYSLMLHPDIENRELSAGGLTPSGSLLTWIDNMYTTPETVFDRRSGRWDNIKRSIKFLPPKVANNMHFKIFSINESEECKDEENCLITEPQEHGDFSKMRFWDEATWTWK